MKNDKMEREQEGDWAHPGIEVAITHKLAPINMILNIGGEERSHYQEKSYPGDVRYFKYHFEYQYLDLYFDINIDDDKTAAKLYPYFSENQRNQIAAMILGQSVKNETRQ